ncbi:Cof-type HAD-IIB family hydrolase [Spirochaeta africana]|uniref:HAD-superfamily hydrolase, subfamily IIB n=1 Tax=Spirochaeta africana (strain ATCC 700263 / DSM 8902 / Z-7692) TaxID=889378 RepID=H9UHK6_SPIAZ|nr:Cof-type HAD-IIB family hydrolase [Spirochaeta africana]AFG36999.1 HAD-superfamily hydrolase, subfamily IIB [Spirochaeta africana DSM 8902]
MDYQLIAFDMDDTLLDAERRVSPENRQALQELVHQGMRIVLCSGRPTPSLLQLARDLFPKAGTDNADEYIVSFNGAAVVAVASGQELHSTPIPVEAGLAILAAAREHGILLQAYSKDQFYTERDDERARDYSQSVGLPFEVVDDLADIIRAGSLKLLMNAPHEQLVQTKRHLQELSDRGELHMVFSKPHYLECLHPGVNKATGLEHLCRMLNLDLQQVIAVGDSHNDLEMLQHAGLGVAVANARDELKAAADMVLESDHTQSIAVELLRRITGLRTDISPKLQ